MSKARTPRERSHWRPLLRVARRDAVRARGRSTLIVAMIAVPVLGLSTIGVLLRSYQLDPGETVARQLGQADARWTDAHTQSPVLQTPTADSWSSGPSAVGDAPFPVAPLATAVPAGSRIVLERKGSAVVHTSAGGDTRTSVREIDWADPLVAGTVHGRSGRAARTVGEVAVSPALMKRAGLHVGDTMELVEPKRSLTVVGVAASFGRARSQEVLVMPGALGDFGAPTAVYVDAPAPVTWGAVTAANQRGLLVLSRSVLLNPPARSAIPYYRNGQTSSDDTSTVLALALVGCLAALEVVLLAGAAFAVGARRQARWLALLSAAGGRSSDVRGVVLSGGLVLGAAGGLVGLLAGIAGAAVVMAVMSARGFPEAGHLDLRVELLAIVVLGVVTGLLAAVLPARTAARQDVVRVLAGRRPVPPVRKRVPVIAVIVTALGVALAAVGSSTALATARSPQISGSSHRLELLAIVGGALLAQVGLVILTPAVLGWLGHLARHLPVSARLAVRDTSRQRGRTAPAVAAVLTAVTGASALLMIVGSTDDHDRRSYSQNLPLGAVSVRLTSFDFGSGNAAPVVHTIDAARVDKAVTAVLGGGPMVVLAEPAAGGCQPSSTVSCASLDLVRPPLARCPLADLTEQPTDAQLKVAESDARCSHGGSGSSGEIPLLIVGGPAELRAVTGRDVSREAAAALAAGGVVTFDPQGVRDGRATVKVYAATSDPETEAPSHEVQVPGAVAVLPGGQTSGGIVSPALATRLGFAARPATSFWGARAAPTATQEERANAALRGLSSGTSLYVERGYVSHYGIGLLALVLGAGLIVLGASAVSTGLAQADARPDQATLAAVGAPPHVRRTIAASQALAVAGIGTVLGILAGLVPALAYIGADESLNAVVPWTSLGGLLVGVPLLAAAFAWLVTRSRLPLERRIG